MSSSFINPGPFFPEANQVVPLEEEQVVPAEGEQVVPSEEKEVVIHSEEEEQASPSSVTQNTLHVISEAWKARDYHAAGDLLQGLELERPTRYSSLSLGVTRLLRGICANFTGQYDAARVFFEEPLFAWDGFPENLTDIQRGSATWLATNFIFTRKFYDAAIAFSIAISPLTLHDATPTPATEQSLRYLHAFDDGAYIGQPNLLRLLAQELASERKTAISVLPGMTRQRKADVLNAAAEYLSSHHPPEAGTSSSQQQEEAGQLPQSTPPAFSIVTALSRPYEPSNGALLLLSHDPTLILAAAPYKYLAEFGMPIASVYLQYRFLSKVHFPFVNLSALHTTRHPITWLASALNTGLAARGFLSAPYWDRVRCVRVREGGAMNYVASFVVVFHKWPVGSRVGIQLPAHLIRDHWRAVRVPGAHLYVRLCEDVKAILGEAERLADAAAGAGGEGQIVDVGPGGGFGFVGEAGEIADPNVDVGNWGDEGYRGDGASMAPSSVATATSRRGFLGMGARMGLGTRRESGYSFATTTSIADSQRTTRARV